MYDFACMSDQLMCALLCKVKTEHIKSILAETRT